MSFLIGCKSHGQNWALLQKCIGMNTKPKLEYDFGYNLWHVKLLDFIPDPEKFHSIFQWTNITSQWSKYKKLLSALLWFHKSFYPAHRVAQQCSHKFRAQRNARRLYSRHTFVPQAQTFVASIAFVCRCGILGNIRLRSTSIDANQRWLKARNSRKRC